MCRAVTALIQSLVLRCIVTPPPATHYSDFDYKVIGYQGKLDREDTVRSSITRSRVER